MSSIDRFNSDMKIIYKGKHVLVGEANSAGSPMLCGYVLSKDPAGNEFFQFEASVKDIERGDSAVWLALIKELDSK